MHKLVIMISSCLNGQFWIRMSCHVQYDQTFCSLVKGLALGFGLHQWSLMQD